MSDILDEKLVKALRGVAELPEEFEITGEQNLRSELGIDSLGMIDLVMHVEEALGIKIGEDSIGNFATVADLQRHVRELSATPVS
ncbi:acyl carrier protein [Streptomyces sp. JB150]|uniref:acyl carrier protein n=1 Tax=Streptomyces sp. JB150 TaxID=2714844 RepID=UPI00140D3847|nr:acyl carrier protein [Streptomyces sp. JB150]QIJ64508.1 acyl carrier protein [Streptomyces sp. JB150]